MTVFHKTKYIPRNEMTATEWRITKIKADRVVKESKASVKEKGMLHRELLK